MASGFVQNGTTVTRMWHGVVRYKMVRHMIGGTFDVYVAWCGTKQCILQDEGKGRDGAARVAFTSAPAQRPTFAGFPSCTNAAETRSNQGRIYQLGFDRLEPTLHFQQKTIKYICPDYG